MPKILILNGPPRCGKDTIADELVTHGWYKAEFKAQLITIALCASRIPRHVWNAHYEYYKDEPWDELHGLTQRQYLILISEQWIKPVHGPDYFGKALIDQIYQLGTGAHIDKHGNLSDAKRSDMPPIVISDSGFPEEIAAIENAFGKENVHIMRVTMEGRTFKNDSRRALKYHTAFQNIYGQFGRLQRYAEELATSHQMLWPSNNTKINPSE